MEAAARNHHALAAPQRGTAVALLQGGLVQVGFSLPLTMKKGTPDGSYGSETVKAVVGFQTANHLSRVDGIAGRETILRLDDMLAKQAFSVDFQYKFYDRYNWDAGKSITFAHITVTDKFMGEFHRQGIAQEYDCYGSFQRTFSWKKGEAIPQTQLDGGGGR